MSLREAARTGRRRASQLLRLAEESHSLRRDLDALRVQVGGLESRLIRDLPADGLREAEVAVFSQFGEDGILQFLIQRVPIEHEVFIEFGVQDYSESNTRFLLEHDNWRGLIIDADPAHVQFAVERGLDWKYQLDTAVAFVDRDNVDEVFRSNGFQGDIGLLSIDIDGNDYWVLQRIESVSPRIIVAEYNSTFGPDAAVTVPYDARFTRLAAHHSNLYWGASLCALARVANEKGYSLVGGNKAGNNAFFVRRDVVGELPEVSPQTAWEPSRFRESLNADGGRSYLSDRVERLIAIQDLPLYEVISGKLVTVGELYQLRFSRTSRGVGEQHLPPLGRDPKSPGTLAPGLTRLTGA